MIKWLAKTKNEVDTTVKSVIQFGNNLSNSRDYTVNAQGNPVLSSNQFKFGQKSAYFDGNSVFSFIQNIGDTTFDLRTGDFTLEWWEYPTSTPLGIYFGSIGAKNRAYDGIIIQSNNGNRTVTASTGINSFNVLNNFNLGSIELNKWTHFALVRMGTNYYGFKNGNLTSTATKSGNLSIDAFVFSLGSWSGKGFVGFVDCVRLSNTARYISNFATPVSSFIVDSYTSFLCYFEDDFSSYLYDECGWGWSLGGSFTYTSFIADTYKKYGKKGLYLPSNVYLYTDYNDIYDISTKDFTFEFFINPQTSNQTSCILNVGGNSSGYGSFMLQISGGKIRLTVSSNGVSWDMVNITGTKILSVGVYYHLAFVRSGSDFIVFIDGVEEIRGFSASSIHVNSENVVIGKQNYNNNFFNGYIGGYCFTEKPKFLSNFTPPNTVFMPVVFNAYHSYTNNAWVNRGLPTTDADIATLFQNYGTDICPTQQQLELLGTGVNRPNRCCYQPVIATQPSININAVPTGKTVKPTELLPISSIEGIDSVSVASTVSTGINDETGKIWTKIGTPTISNTQSKFGGNSLYLDGNSYLSTPITSDLNLSTGDFTIEWWEYRTNASVHLTTLTFDTGTTSGVYDFILGYSDGANVLCYASSNNSSWDILNGLSLGSISVNQWSHYTLVRSGNVFTTYKDGIKVSTATSSLPINFNILTTLLIGNSLSPVNGIYTGYIDEVRISNNARYTANFTPPTAPYLKDVGTISLLHFDSSVAKLKLAVTLDLVTYYKFNGNAWEVIDINTNQDNMMDTATVTSINRSQWDLLTNGTASGIAFAYYLDISGMGDTVKIDKTSLVVDMKGEWNSATKGTDFRYGYPANDRLKVTLLTTGNYKINYVGG